MIFARIAMLLFMCAVNTAAWNSLATAAERVVRQDLERVFDDAGVAGTFVLFDVTADRLILVNPDRADRRFFPASTFKVANSLIALATDVVADENEIIPFGGKPQRVKAWEADMSMRDAIVISNVPIYQELARRIGPQRYREWLSRLAYGNAQIGSRHQDFWLVGPLAISAVEQVSFLARLARSRLPAAVDNQRTVHDILRIEKSGRRVLYAKSGWTTAPDPQIGWWVGWIEDQHTGNITAFALNLDVAGQRTVGLREPLARHLLVELGYWDPS